MGTEKFAEIGTESDESIGAGLVRRFDRLDVLQPPLKPRPAMRGSMTAEHTSRHATRSLGLAVAVAVALAGGLLVRTGGVFTAPRVGAPASSPSTVAAAGQHGLTELARIPLSGASYSMVYDNARNSFWFSVFTVGGPDTLYRYDLASGLLSTQLLPDVDDTGFLAQTAVAPDGSIWVTEPYQIVRFDPSTNSMSSQEFGKSDPDAVTTDDDRGTWLSAIAFDTSGNAVLTRHNTTSLVRVDASLKVVGRIKLPNEYVSSESLADDHGRLFVAPPITAHAPVLVLDEKGSQIAKSTDKARAVVASHGHVIGLGDGPLFSVGKDASTDVVVNYPTEPNDRADATSDGGMVIYRRGMNTIERYGPDGRKLVSVALPMAEKEIDNPLGGKTKTKITPMITALATDASDRIAFVENGTLVIAQLI